MNSVRQEDAACNTIVITTKPIPQIRIVCISDTHELHRNWRCLQATSLSMPETSRSSQRPSMLRDFDRWLGELPHRYNWVVIPGNHDYFLE